MEKDVIERLLKDNSLEFIPNSNGAAIVDGVLVDYSLFYLTDLKFCVERILRHSDKKGFVVKHNSPADEIIDTLRVLKNNSEEKDFKINYKSSREIEVLSQNNELIAKFSRKKNEFELLEEKKSFDKTVFAEQLKQDLSLETVYLFINTLYKETHLIRNIDKSTLYMLIAVNHDIFHEKVPVIF
ncbi:MAG: hypothetical protein HUJ68_07500 [Clostridia bacterium]|nr:hypothetical protein [Clostridia bacterium]